MHFHLKNENTKTILEAVTMDDKRTTAIFCGKVQVVNTEV